MKLSELADPVKYAELKARLQVAEDKKREKQEQMWDELSAEVERHPLCGPRPK
jgi:hypothetical protein